MPLRPLLAAGVVVFILGSVYAYTLFLGHLKARAQDEARAREQEVKAAAEGKFEVEVMPTFSVTPDEFNTTLAEVKPSLKVLLRGPKGRTLVERKDAVEAYKPIRIEAPEILEGDNVFWVEGSPSTSDPNPPAVRIRVLRNDIELAQATYWGDTGARVGGEIKIRVTKLPGDHH